MTDEQLTVYSALLDAHDRYTAWLIEVFGSQGGEPVHVVSLPGLMRWLRREVEAERESRNDRP